MTNGNTTLAWRYHNTTKHSPSSVRNSGHWLDWSNKPIPFKIYPTLEPIRLGESIGRTEVPALQAVSTTVTHGQKDAAPNLHELSQLLYFSAGVTKKVEYPGGIQYFRAASCTGALYEIELYIVCRNLEGLDAGVYHFGPGDFALRGLREGDFRGVLRSATGNNLAVAHAPAVVVCTGTYWRNAWKYQARTYRHFGWDNGTILANLLAVATALGLPAQVICGFVDADVNRLLDLDTEREVAFSMVALGHVRAASGGPLQVSRLNLETVPLSETEVDYPDMGRVHQASSLETAEEVVAWRGGMSLTPKPSSGNEVVPLSPLSEDEISEDSIESVILRRGSTRQFARIALAHEPFATMLDRASREIPADFLGSDRSFLNDIYLIVNGVEGVEAGSYVYDREEKTLELLRRGNFRGVAAHLGLDQSLPGDASVAVFFMADLERILERFGNRGYRCVQLESGILGGKLYLTAYAERLGATGLTFYDDEVIEFFSPHAAGKSAIFLMALGKSVRRR